MVVLLIGVRSYFIYVIITGNLLSGIQNKYVFLFSIKDSTRDSIKLLDDSNIKAVEAITSNLGIVKVCFFFRTIF